MQLIADRPRPAQQLAGSDQPSRQWFRGPDAAVERPLGENHLRSYSYASECECPDDCLRDHANE